MANNNQLRALRIYQQQVKLLIGRSLTPAQANTLIRLTAGL